MTNQNFTTENRTDALGRALTARMDRDMPELSYDISERLRAARMQAIAARKPEPITALAPVLNLSAGQGTLGWGQEGGNLWNRLASFVPLVALIFGLIAIQSIQSESNTTEIAEVDSALLVDELPPTAYTDPGFLQFLKTNRNDQTETH